MGISNHKCDRCGKDTIVFKMSFFNKDECCRNCILIESMHDNYESARAVERNECQKGNYNYEGVGLPDDYNEWSNLLQNEFNFEIYSKPSYYGIPNEEKYYLRDKDCKFQLCLNDLKIQSCDYNTNKIALKEINSLEELEEFMNFANLKYDKNIIKEFFFENIKRK